MPKVSKESVTEVRDYGVAEDRTGNLDGYTVNFVSIRQDHDLAPMLSGLPEGRCPCPHWGYVLKGRMTVRYADHEEVCEAGEAFYLPPGHTPAGGRQRNYPDQPQRPAAGGRGGDSEGHAADAGCLSTASAGSPGDTSTVIRTLRP